MAIGMKKKYIKYAAITIVLLAVTIFICDLLFGLKSIDTSKSDAVSITWTQHDIHSKYNEIVIKRADNPELFANLEGTITNCNYRTLEYLDESTFGHEYGVKSFQMRFFDESTNELILSYTVYTDGVLIINDKFMACGLLSRYNLEDIYNSIDDLIHLET